MIGIGIGIGSWRSSGVPRAPGTNSALVASITGTPYVGETLTAAVSGDRGFPMGVLTYVWLADATPIDGATASTYVLQAADDGANITVAITATNDWNEDETPDTTSDTSDAVAVTYPPPELLTASISPAGGASDVEYTTSYTADEESGATIAYQWKLDLANVGTDSATYTPTAAGSLSCVVTATSTGGVDTATAIAVTITSDDPAIVAPFPSISGAGVIDAPHSLVELNTTGTVDTTTYSWMVNGVEDGTSATYTPAEADDGDALTCEVTVAKSGGGSDSYTTAPVTIRYNIPTGIDDSAVFTENSGEQSFDVSQLFNVVGDADQSGVTYSIGDTGSGLFDAGLFEAGLFEEGADYVGFSVPPTLTVDTDTSGIVSGVEFTIFATNSGGTASAVLTLYVTEAASGTPLGTFPLALTQES